MSAPDPSPGEELFRDLLQHARAGSTEALGKALSYYEFIVRHQVRRRQLKKSVDAFQ